MSNITYTYKDDVNAQNDPWLVLAQVRDVLNGTSGTGTGIQPSALSTSQRTGFIPIPIHNARIISSNDFQDQTTVSTGGSEKAPGGILASLGAIYSINRVNGATDKAARIVAKNNTTGELQFPMIPMPYDLDDTANVIVNIYARMAGATDTPTLTIGAYFDVGDTDCGGATTALSNVLTAKTVTLAAADVPAYPCMLNLSLIPGAHTTDALWIYGAWLTYTRKA